MKQNYIGLWFRYEKMAPVCISDAADTEFAKCFTTPNEVYKWEQGRTNDEYHVSHAYHHIPGDTVQCLCHIRKQTLMFW